MSLYDILGVARDASAAAIKAAGRKLQKKTHPDAGGSTEEFQKVQHALTILLDPDKRAHYDRTGEEQGSRTSEEDLQKHEAMALLAQLLNEAMGKDHRYNSIVGHIRARADENMIGLRNQLRQAESDAGQKLNKIEDVLRRLKKGKKSSSVLVDMINAQAADVNREIEMKRAITNRSMLIWGKVINLVEGYDYEVEPMPPPQAFNPFGPNPADLDPMGRPYPQGMPPHMRPEYDRMVIMVAQQQRNQRGGFR